MATSIQVDFYNDTKENLTVVILGEKVDLPSLYLDNAWLTLPVAQKSYASFNYPQETSVGVYYKNKYGVLITTGPYPANPGSHWNAMMTSEYSPLTLQEDKSVPSSESSIWVRNQPPTGWSGREINVGLYKGIGNNNPIVNLTNIAVGESVELKQSNTLYFSVIAVSPTPAQSALSGVTSYIIQKDEYFGLSTDIKTIQRQGKTIGALNVNLIPPSLDIHTTAMIAGNPIPVAGQEVFSSLTLVELDNFPNGIEVTLSEQPGGQYIFQTSQEI